MSTFADPFIDQVIQQPPPAPAPSNMGGNQSGWNSSGGLGGGFYRDLIARNRRNREHLRGTYNTTGWWNPFRNATFQGQALFPVQNQYRQAALRDLTMTMTPQTVAQRNAANPYTGGVPMPGMPNVTVHPETATLFPMRGQTKPLTRRNR